MHEGIAGAARFRVADDGDPLGRVGVDGGPPEGGSLGGDPPLTVVGVGDHDDPVGVHHRGDAIVFDGVGDVSCGPADLDEVGRFVAVGCHPPVAGGDGGDPPVFPVDGHPPPGRGLRQADHLAVLPLDEES